LDKLRSIEVFIEVAQGLSFSAAAQRLGMAKGNVTKHIAWLEHELGAQLLTRTTKSVSLTDAGLALMQNGRDLLDRVDDVEASVRNSVGEARGVLRVGSPPSFGAFHLVPVVTAFAHAHPDIQVVMYLDDGRADLVTEGLDISVRIAATLKDSSQVAQRLATVPQVLVAASSYLKRRGTPATVADLKHHDCMVHTLKSPTQSWNFTGPDGPISVRVTGTLRANFGEPLRHAALLGHGISMHPTYMVADDLKKRRLEAVLGQYVPTGLDIYAVVPSRRSLPTRVQTFMKFLKLWFGQPDWLRHGGEP
jgi:DNA-binding transcriptional LysR family regulator